MAEHPLYKQEHRAGNGTAARMPWLARAVREGTFQLVLECLEASVKVCTPLAEHDVCTALLSYIVEGVGPDQTTQPSCCCSNSEALKLYVPPAPF